MKVTLASLDQKLDDLKELMKDHIDEDHAKHAVVDTHTIAIDRLQQVESNRVWHIRAIWVALLAGLGSWMAGIAK